MAIILKMLITTTYLWNITNKLLTKRPIDHLTNNSAENMKVIVLKDLYTTEYTKVILRIPIPVNYLLMVMKGLSQDKEYIV